MRGDVGWHTALPIMVTGLLGLVWIYWDTAISMYDLWSLIHSYNHAFLVIPVCLFLAWERRDVLRRLQPRPSLFGTLVVFGFGGLWLIADAVDVMAGRHVALVGMMQGLVLATLGWQVCRALLFPLLYAWLVVPVDFGLLPVLQNMAAVASAWGIGAIGIPIFVEGLFIEVPTGRYWVAPGCAGLNFLLSGFALSLLYGEQMYNGWRKRVACVVIMIVIAIVANWIRIFGLITAGHFFDEIYDINDHYTEGWLFFAVVVFFMMWIGLRFRDPVRKRKVEDEESGPIAATRAAPAAIAFYVAVATATAAGGAMYPAYAAYRAGEVLPSAAVHVAAPQQIAGWKLSSETSNWAPVFEGADAQATLRYNKGTNSVDLYVAYYERQGNGREVAAHQNRVDDKENWRQQRIGAARLNVGGAPTQMTVTHLRSNTQQRKVWHAYWVDGRLMRSPVLAKLLQAKSDLFFGDRRAGFVAVSSADIEDAAVLETFFQALPSIPDLIASGAAGG